MHPSRHCLRRKMVFRTIRSPYCLLFALIMLISILLLAHNFSKPAAREIVKTKLFKIQPESRTAKLKQVLRRASMPDRSVILTIVDQTWASPGSILDLFLESFRIGHGTKHFLNHLVIVAVDNKAFHYCNSIHPHCFFLANTTTPLLMPSLKFKLLEQVIELGYNLFFTDADVMWFRNPATYIVDMKELEIVCNFYSVDPPSIASEVDGGFFHLKSNEISLDYFKYWELKRVLYPNSQSQSLCEATVTDPFFEMIGFRVKYLEESHFNGFCQQRRNMSEIVTVRANCCDSIQSKVHDLKLLHEDWRHFTALSSGKTSLRGSSFTWRVPSKCKS